MHSIRFYLQKTLFCGLLSLFLGVLSASAASPYAGFYSGYVYFSISGVITQPEQPVGFAAFTVDENGNVSGNDMTGTVNGSGAITWNANSTGFTTGTISGGVLASTTSQNNGGAISTTRIAANNTAGGFGGGAGTVAANLIWRSPTPSGSSAGQNIMYGVTYGGGKYVAVGSAGNIATSGNGTNWISGTANTTQKLNAVAYGNSMYVAIGDAATVISSPDAITWTARSINGSPLQNNVGVTFGNGKFVIANLVGEIFTSTDGISWTKIGSPPAIGNPANVKYVGNRFVLVGAISTTTGTISTSTDGTTWGTVKSFANANTIMDVAFGNSKWVCVNATRSFTFAASDASDATATLFSGLSDAVGFINGLFVADNRYFSADGITWSRESYPNIDINDTFTANGIMVTVGAGTTSTTDGKIWTTHTKVLPLAAVNNVGFNGIVSGDIYDEIQYYNFQGITHYVRMGVGGLIDDKVFNGSYTNIPSPTTNTLRAGYGDTTGGVAVGDGGAIARYGSGVNAWTNITGVTSANLTSVAANGNIWVAVGAGGTIIRSANSGQTWSTVSSGTGNTLNRVVFLSTGFNYFIAVGNNGTILKSTDSNGTSWTVLTTGSTKRLVGVGGRTVPVSRLQAVAEDSTVLVSEGTTGATWRAIIVNAPYPITWADAGNARGGSGFLMTTSDGTNWTYSLPLTGISGLASGNGKFVGYGQTFVSTTDLNNWNSVSPPSGHVPAGIAYANGLFLSLGTGNTTTGNGFIAASTDGVKWTTRTVPTINQLTSAAYGNGRYVAVGTVGGIFSSTDTVTWVNRTITGSQSLNSIIYANGKFVAVGDSGATRYSTDGESWTAGTANTGNRMLSITYGKGLYVAVGENATLRTSPDGITWTTRTTTPATGATRIFFSVSFTGNLFIIVGSQDGANGAVVASSTDGITWTKDVSNFAFGLTASAAGNGSFVAAGGNNAVVSASYQSAVTPPAITGQPSPASQTVSAGVTVSYTATVTGTGNTLQWFKDGFPLANGPGVAGANTATLTLTGVDVLDSGTYQLAVYNDGGGALTTSLVLNVNGPPIITVHPISTTTSNTLTTNFTVTAVGPGILTYKWRKNGNDLVEGGHYSGVSTAKLVISTASGADEATYDVIVSNNYGSSAPSTGAFLTVKRPATVTQPPAAVKVKQGETVQLTAQVDGSATIAYTWKKDGVVVTDGGRISGATTPTLTITGGLVSDRGLYTLSVTNSFLPGATSTAAHVSVLGPGALHHDFTRQLSGSAAYTIVPAENGEYLIGGDLHFFQSPFGSSDVFRMSRNGTGNTNFSAGGTGTSGAVLGIGELNNGKVMVGGFTSWIGMPGFTYHLQLNANGSVNTNFVSPVANSIKRILRLPDGKFLVADTTVSPGDRRIRRYHPDGTLDNTFTTTTMSGQLTDMAVQSDGKILLSDVGGIKRLNADGTGLTGYLVTGNVFAMQVGPDDKIYFSKDGAYKRVTKDAVDDSATFSVPVAGGSVFGSVFLPDGRMVIVGNFSSVNSAPNTALIALLEVNGTPNAGFLSPYTWIDAVNTRLNTIALAEDGSLLVGGNIAFNLPTIQYLVQRIYLSENNLYFNTRPASQTVNRNGSVTFTAEGGGTTAITSYQWRKNGQNIVGATSTSYTINGVQDSDAASYDVLITNGSGTIPSNAATLTVLGDVIITAQPQSLQKSVTQTATFSVSVNGNSALPVTYQWRKNGVNITGATNATYAVMATVDTAAQYDVVVSSPVNSVTSSSASLSVNYPTAAGGTIGTLNTSFNPSSMTGQNGPPVRGLDLDPQGRVYVTGSFGTYNSQTRNKFMRLNQDLALDMNFAPSFSTPSAGTSPVITRFLPNGEYLIGGFLTAVNGNARYGIARFDSADQLLSGPTLSSFTYLGDNNSYGVGITVNSDGSYFLTGNFTTVNSTSRANIAKVKADHTLDTGFVPSSYPDAAMRSTAVDSLGRVIASGSVSTAGAVAHAGLVRYLADGTLDTSFNTQVNLASSGPVNIGFQSTGKIILIGVFTSVKDNPGAIAQTRYGIARLNTDGTVDTTFDANLSANAQIYDMIIQPDNKIIIVGNFTTVNGTNRQRIARLNADGTLDTTFGSSSASGGAPDVIYTITQLTTGDYLIGGSFTSFAGDNSKQYLARLHGQPPAAPALDITQEPTSKTVYPGETVTFSVAAVGAGSLTFQWYKGSTPLGVTTPQLVLSDVDGDDAGNYHVVVTDSTTATVTSVDAVLTVNEPLSFEAWMISQGLTSGGNLGPDDDVDGDGVKNVVEYVFGTQANNSGSKPVIEKVVVNDNSTDYYGIRAVILNDVEDVEVIITASTDATFATTIGTIITEADLGTTKQVTIRTGIPKISTTKIFFRIVIRGVVIEP